jgi:hypothetical protein
MNIGKDKLYPANNLVVGFVGEKVYPFGSISLPVTVGTPK